MITVPQFNSPPDLQSLVLYGKPSNQYTVKGGLVAVFPDDALVLYQLQTKSLQTYLFQGTGSILIPGVRPCVNLLLHATNASQSRQLTHTIFWLAEHGQAPEKLSDALWQRVTSALEKEAYSDQDLCLLLH